MPFDSGGKLQRERQGEAWGYYASEAYLLYLRRTTESIVSGIKSVHKNYKLQLIIYACGPSPCISGMARTYWSISEQNTVNERRFMSCARCSHSCSLLVNRFKAVLGVTATRAVRRKMEAEYSLDKLLCFLYIFNQVVIQSSHMGFIEMSKPR